MGEITIHDLVRLRPRLLSFARSRLRDPDQAEDAVQEALLAALEGLNRFSGASSPATWLYGILRHKIVDAMRKSGREQPLDGTEAEMLLPGSDPEEAFSRGRVAQALERGFKSLPGRAARVFLMREGWGMDTAEVCGELAISAANCSVLLFRARRRLRAFPEILSLAAEA